MFIEWWLIVAVLLGIYWLTDTIATIQKRLNNIERYINDKSPRYDDDDD